MDNFPSSPSEIARISKDGEVAISEIASRAQLCEIITAMAKYIQALTRVGSEVEETEWPDEIDA